MTQHLAIVACSLPKEQRAARAKQLREGLMQRIRSVRDLPDGLALRFSSGDELHAELREFIEFEKGCCGFARFELREAPGEQGLWLEVRGPSGTREFVSQLVPEGMPIEPISGR